MRLLIFDRTAPHLRHAWLMGAGLYRALGRVDDSFGATSWQEGLGWLARAREPITEVQYWGHGRWGVALVASDRFDASALRAEHPLHVALEGLRERLAPKALFWFRTCETFGANLGQDFAMRLSDWLGARVAGHTFVIGALQSGLHGLLPGHAPDWPKNEGLAEGSPAAPIRAQRSAPGRPHTVTCFSGRVPPDWFSHSYDTTIWQRDSVHRGNA